LAAKYSESDTPTRVGIGINRPAQYIRQYVSPLLYRLQTLVTRRSKLVEIESEEQFWRIAGSLTMGPLRLNSFRVSDWFPRLPGLYWEPHAKATRSDRFLKHIRQDTELGLYYPPIAKENIIEQGGVGTIRLVPRVIENERSWFASATTGTLCHAGIPLIIPDSVFRASGLEWGDAADIYGEVRFREELGLDDIFPAANSVRPVIVLVEKLLPVAPKSDLEHLFISPVVLFGSEKNAEGRSRFQFAYVQCRAGSDEELNSAVGWLETYTSRYHGRILTNFDQQRPSFENAPLSYQRLVAHTYDKAVAQDVDPDGRLVKIVQHIDKQIIVQPGGSLGDIINVNNSPNAVIKSKNVVLIVQNATGLNPEEKLS
jgi:hypothetical protein